MTASLQTAWIVRHGETEWSLAGRHTGRTDLPLTARGDQSARRLGARLAGREFAAVYTSPLIRAARTCELAGFGAAARADPDLAEWDYGDYEGRRTVDIRVDRPDWRIFRDGCPRGETPQEVGTRVDRVVKRLRAVDGDVLVFSSSHLLRVLAARWLGLAPAMGKCFALSTASLGALGYEHDRESPAIRLWNDTCHDEP
jgi:broad specificity phosphatase PhoE